MADYSSSAGIFASVVFGAFTLRYLSFLSGVNDWTYDRIEFSTPVVSWKRGMLCSSLTLTLNLTLNFSATLVPTNFVFLKWCI